MLDKPKFLTGEVKEFIDWLEHYEYEPQIVGGARSEYGLTNREKINCYEEEMIERREIIGFYNQPFETAMIEKYFKGWVKTKDLSFIVMNGNNRILIGKKAIYEDQGRDVFADNYLFPKPRTLNHFISDCKRAGIKLEWRE